MSSVKVAYSVQEVAQLLGISTDKVYELLRANEIPHKRIGRRYIIPCVLFDGWLNRADPWAPAHG